jgi:ABC-type transport system involved in multi-copper enzyme maturation permease subunit
VLVTTSRAGWGLPDQRVRRASATYRQYSERLLPHNRYDLKALPPLAPYEAPAPFNPVKNGIQSLILSIPHAVFQSEKFVRDWGYMNYSKWVVLGAFLTFVLPLFTLSYATAAFGTDRESRSLVWLMTRPIPRSGIYLAKFVGTLPWCVAFGLGGFAALCLAGGEHGRMALAMYWPAAALATVAFSALFHLIGAIFRRPVVVGLVYVFFFEALVGNLPGSLKLLSLTFYARCLMYNAAEAAGFPAEMLDVPQAVSPATAWAVLAAAAVLLTAAGMWLFSRSEYRDDV